ncbi:cysteine/glutathione ABC transporter ATP-binding protein/permease CydC [Mixta theicola]|uniref:Glutathione/L-cysteine transport system ATP-binding/permease protein CydC n=1 Tax=Mixta theicola TaxID=1458355 RepID=A0A2K1QET0_9GAMM|nr:cysteine/glutathione ABC transporter ATP-binding protein/permease CydC [Mixta theicola]PNS13542.1 cysteine/glutathione ABC transporter ATP-binding protein/permease CydC [Mixta theicola]GLR09863.1 ATP-binding/permease protein CydC [Mixta theicola]
MAKLRPFLRLYRRHSWRLLAGVLLAIVTLLASTGLLTLSGWFLAASSLAGTAGLYSFNYMLPAAGVRGAAIIRTVARYFERLISHDGTFRVLQHLRVFTFSRLLPLSPAGLTRLRQGDLLNRFVADVDTLDHLYLRVISPFCGALVVIIVVTLGLCWLDVSLSLTLGTSMLLTLLLLPPLFYRAGRSSGEIITAERARYRLQLTHWLQAQAELSLYGSVRAWRSQLDAVEQRWQQAQRRQASLTGLSQALLLLISGATVTLLLWLSAGGVGDWPQPGALIALLVFCSLAAFEALAPVGTAFQHLGQVFASAERISQLIDQTPAVQFPAKQSDDIPAPGTLALKQVTFSYPDTVSPALQRLTLKVNNGETIALLGPTGCGKSTLLQLLTRAWDPQQGEIWLQGIPLGQWSEPALRAAISVVSQRVDLFNQTLRDNLLLAAPGSSNEALSAVLAQVGLEKLLDGAGLNAWLGEGGRQLSGGELRRLAIARALLHNGPIMLLDEPTEGLDAETEQHILALLAQVTANKTVIIVTHRLQGLDKVDRIYVMDQGEIIEQGTHPELMAKGGRYWHFQQRFTL